MTETAAPTDGVYLAEDLQRPRLSIEDIGLLRAVCCWARAQGWTVERETLDGARYVTWSLPEPNDSAGRQVWFSWIPGIDNGTLTIGGLAELEPRSLREAVDVLAALQLLPAEHCSAYRAGRLSMVDDDGDHIINLRVDGFTLKHPWTCRETGLFECAFNDGGRAMSMPAELGQYRCDLDADGNLVLGERIR